MEANKEFIWVFIVSAALLIGFPILMDSLASGGGGSGGGGTTVNNYNNYTYWNVTNVTNLTNNITTVNNLTNNITNNITQNITNNITTYVNTTNNITYNITNNITQNITNNITQNITNNITNNFTTVNNITNNITYGKTSLIISGKSSAAITADAYGNPYGGLMSSASDASSCMVVPFASKIHNLTAYAEANQGSGDTCVYYVRNATGGCTGTFANTALTCTVANVAQSCSDVAHLVSIPAGDGLQIYYDEAGGTCTGAISWTFVLTPD